MIRLHKSEMEKEGGHACRQTGEGGLRSRAAGRPDGEGDLFLRNLAGVLSQATTSVAYPVADRSAGGLPARPVLASGRDPPEIGKLVLK
jgi:hypothetical protein